MADAISGEVAALIERLRQRARSIYIAVDKIVADDLSGVLNEAAAALARLSAPVPEPPDTFVRVAAEALQRVKWRLDPFHGKNIELAREIVDDEMAQLPKRNDELTFQYRAVQYLTKNPPEGAAPVPAREWIPVGERLPDKGDFIVYLKRGRRNAFNFTEWTMTQFDGSGLVPFATHWMPLPPPPAADK